MKPTFSRDLWTQVAWLSSWPVFLLAGVGLKGSMVDLRPLASDADGGGCDSRRIRRRIPGREEAMRASTTDRLARWTRGVGLMALAALAWAMLVPSGVFWTAALGAGLIASAVAMAVLVRGPSFPSLAQELLRNLTLFCVPEILTATEGPILYSGTRPRMMCLWSERVPILIVYS